VKKLWVLLLTVFLLTGCTKYVKDNKKNVKLEETGQMMVKNILCQPESQKTIDAYLKYKIDVKELPKCTKLSYTNTKYEGLWETIFVNSIAIVIIKLGSFLKSYGLAIVLITIIIRLLMYPVTKKSAMQSENMQKAKPELDNLEKKYTGKTAQDDMMRKSQEMMMIYKKYKINPLAGCIFALIQIPLFFAFFEGMNRLPAIFETNFLGFQLGTSPSTALASNGYHYLIIVVLVGLTTFFSFKLNSNASMSKEMEKQMKMVSNISIVFIVIASITMSVGIAIYWITNSSFTILQNLLVKRGKKNAKVRLSS
jgi:YidC/Oxa1 family membrane protein insertase